jgi:hypothetical protein
MSPAPAINLTNPLATLLNSSHICCKTQVLSVSSSSLLFFFSIHYLFAIVAFLSGDSCLDNAINLSI